MGSSSSPCSSPASKVISFRSSRNFSRAETFFCACSCLGRRGCFCFKVLLGCRDGPSAKRAVKVPLLRMDWLRPTAILPLRDIDRDMERPFLDNFEREEDRGTSAELPQQQWKAPNSSRRGQQRQRMLIARYLHLASKAAQALDRSWKQRAHGAQQRPILREQAQQRSFQRARTWESRAQHPKHPQHAQARDSLDLLRGLGPLGSSPGSTSDRFGVKLSIPSTWPERRGDTVSLSGIPDPFLVHERVRDIAEAAFLAALSFMTAVLVTTASLSDSRSSSGYDPPLSPSQDSSPSSREPARCGIGASDSNPNSKS